MRCATLNELHGHGAQIGNQQVVILVVHRDGRRHGAPTSQLHRDCAVKPQQQGHLLGGINIQEVRRLELVAEWNLLFLSF